MRFAGWLILPAILCALGIGGGLVLALALGLEGTKLFRDYADVAMLFTFITLLIWALIPWFRAPDQRHLGPISIIIATLRERWLLMILPAALLPIFMTGFTTMKIGVPLLTGYHFDGLWTMADASLFGTDPWRITHAVIGVRGTALLSMAYTLGWGLALAFVPTIYALSAEPRRVTRAFAAFFAMWLIGGVLGTALFSSVGPIFAHVVDPTLEARFAPLHDSLATLLPGDGAILYSQEYLRQRIGLFEIFRAGGVSAMPSMHLAVCTWLILLAGRTAWRGAAIVWWLTIWIGSVHFGYHYALDGVFGAVIAWGCWKVCMASSATIAVPAAPTPQLAPNNCGRA